ARQFAAGEGLDVSARVAALAAEGAKVMFTARLKLGAMLVLAVGVLAAAVGFAAQQAGTAIPPAAGYAELPGAPSKSPVKPDAQGNQPRGARVDRNGDPLPAGALFRFGSLRLRHDGKISASALSPDGKTLATTSGQSVVLWDLATDKPLRRFSTDGFWTFSIPTLVFAPDGSRLGYVQAQSF